MDEPHWVKRFTEHGAPGAYLRVVAEGTVGAGDRVTVVDRPAHGVTVGDVFVMRRVDAERLQRLLDEQPDLAPDLDARRPPRPRRPRPLTRAVRTVPLSGALLQVRTARICRNAPLNGWRRADTAPAGRRAGPALSR